MAFDAQEYLEYFGFQRIKDHDEENIMASCYNSGNHSNDDKKRSFGMLKKGAWRDGKFVPAGTCNCYVCGGWTLENLTAELLTERERLAGGSHKFNEYEAFQFLQQKGWLPDEEELDAAKVLENIKKVDEPKVVQSRIFPEDILLPYSNSLHKLALKRGLNPNAISVAMARAWGLGYDSYTRRIIIPVRNEKGELVGVTSRAVAEDGFIRYGIGTVHPDWWTAMVQNTRYDGEKMLYVFDKGQYVFGEHLWNPELETVLVIESPLDVIYAHEVGLHEHMNIGAVFGSKVTRAQLQKLCRHKYVVEGLDNDKGGEEGREKFHKDIMGRATAYKFDSYGKKDLGDCTPEEVAAAPTRFVATTKTMFNHIKEMT
jgi:hypothetical protein